MVATIKYVIIVLGLLLLLICLLLSLYDVYVYGYGQMPADLGFMDVHPKYGLRYLRGNEYELSDSIHIPYEKWGAPWSSESSFPSTL